MDTHNEDKYFHALIEKIADICSNGNPNAKEYLQKIIYVTEIIDDLIDKDKEVNDETILKTFFILSCELYINPFFMANSNLLVSIHVSAYNAWMDANIWEKSGDELKKVYAHVIRSSICELCYMVAYLTGGYEYMRKVSPIVRESLKENYDKKNI